jgi:hypothetical protein
MRRRRVLVPGGGVLAVAVAVVIVYRLGGDVPERQSVENGGVERPRTPGRSSGDRAGQTGPKASPGPEAAPAGLQRVTLQEARAQSQALQEATGHFVEESIAKVETCLGPSAGPREPHNVLVTFKREEANGEDAGFVAAAVRSLPSPGGAPRIDDRIRRCLQTLEGTPLGLSLDVPRTSEIQRVITLVLPARPGPSGP